MIPIVTAVIAGAITLICRIRSARPLNKMLREAADRLADERQYRNEASDASQAQKRDEYVKKSEENLAFWRKMRHEGLFLMSRSLETTVLVALVPMATFSTAQLILFIVP